jgi:hypothetical protein
MEIGILTIYVLSFINVFYYMKDMNLYTMVEKKTLFPLFACRSMPQSQDVIQKDGSVRPQLWHMEWFSSMMLQDVLVGMASKIIGHTFETYWRRIFLTPWMRNDIESVKVWRNLTSCRTGCRDQGGGRSFDGGSSFLVVLWRNLTSSQAKLPRGSLD